MQTIEEGAKSSISLSLLDFKDLKNGAYFDENGKEIKADKRTDDEQIGSRLWQMSE